MYHTQQSMTSQQLMMNSLGIALASDSTMTLGSSGRTYPSVNKIFSLAGRQPVAFMVSNAANYIPAAIAWERVIGLYRVYRRDEELPALKDYVLDFMKFVSSHETLQVSSVNDIAIQSDLISFFTKSIKPAEEREKIKRETGYSMPQLWEETDLTDYFDVAINTRIEHILEQVRGQKLEKSKEKESAEWDNLQFRVQQRHHENIENAATEFVKRHGCEKFFNEICEIFHFHLCVNGHSFDWKAKSKIVICGFGKEEMRPTMCSFEVGCNTGDGPFSSVTRFYIRNKRSYSDRGNWLEEESDENEELWSTTGFSQGFAHKNNIETLLTGIHPYTKKQLNFKLSGKIMDTLAPKLFDLISQVDGVGKATIEKISARLGDGNYELYNEIENSIHKMVYDEWAYNRGRFDKVTANVPIEELTRFVEILVGLEAQVSHYLNDVRSVGGPIDVASITKEDGFIWVKSKQIHNNDINPRVSIVKRDNANLI